MCNLLTYFLLISIYVRFSLQNPLVELPNGQILGREDTTLEGKTYYSFVKIPYATPPVGELRFKPPRPALNWDGVLNATQTDVSCIQLTPFGLKRAVPGVESEDCLFINVYTPKLPTEEDKELLPVMVFIHGGAYLFGNNYEDGPDLLINNDVIFVMMNYRLGLFGFLSTEDETIPGNYGLKDQTLALNWIRDNIHFFGGDPERVTIFGQSAGAGSCAFHTLNQNAEGLFSGVILESGTFLSPGMFQRNSRKIAFGIAAILNSTFETSENSEDLLEFLLSLDATELNDAAKTYSAKTQNLWDSFIEPGSIFAPVIETENPHGIVREKMYVSLKAGDVWTVPTIMGFTSEEKIVMGQSGENSLREILSALDENLELIVSDDMQITNSTQRAEMGGLIREIYTGAEPFTDNLGAGIRYSSDNFLSRPMIRHAEIYSSLAKTYFYQFSFEGDLDSISIHYEGAGSVAHGSDRNYLFCRGSACSTDHISEADVLTRQRLIKLWTNFAKYRNPTPEPLELLQNVTWPEVSVDDEDFFYLDIDENLEVKNHPKEATYQKWIELYDSLDYEDFDTY